MDRVAHLREDLAFVDRMIAECRDHISRLQKTAAVMSRDGQDTDLANDVLASFTAALARYKAERKHVVSALKGGKPIADNAVVDLDEARSPQAHVSRRRASRRAKRSGSRTAVA